MSSLAWVVGAWSMLVSIVAPTPPEAHTGPPEGAHEAQNAFVSAYTCEPVYANPMTPCNVTRWGSDPFTHGAACPAAWAWREVFVAGRWWTCDDTPRHDVINGLPHIDLRMATLAEAINWGVQVREVKLE